MNNRILTLLLSVLISVTFDCQAQNKVEVLFIGSYHMAGTGDAMKVEADNILSSNRQKQINELLDLLQTYHPTKIFIENTAARQVYWDSLYTLAEKGMLPNDAWARSESYQLGTKLAHRLKLPKAVVCVDWQQTDTDDLSPFDSLYQHYVKTITTSQLYQSVQSDPKALYSDNAKSVITDIQTMYSRVAKMPLKEALLLLNSPAVQKKLFYANDVMLMDKNALDYGVTGANFNVVRNQQIYTNILHHITPSDRRVMVIYGAGHTEALRHMVEGNPGFILIPLTQFIR